MYARKVRFVSWGLPSLHFKYNPVDDVDAQE